MVADDAMPVMFYKFFAYLVNPIVMSDPLHCYTARLKQHFKFNVKFAETKSSLLFCAIKHTPTIIHRV